MLSNPRKRVLVQDESLSLGAQLGKRRAGAYDDAQLPRVGSAECARLVTHDPSQGKRALILELGRPFSIGRAPVADYAIADRSVSNSHCRLYSLVSDTGQVLVCLRDVSSNGTLHNDRKLSHSTVILRTGDRIEIGRRVLRFFQTMHETPATGPPPPHVGPLADDGGAPRFDRVGDYVVLPCILGSGAFATVVLAFDLKRLNQVACKKMVKKVVTEQNLAAVRKEVEMLKQASHPNINKIVDVEVADGIVHIFLELVSGGDLFSYLVKKGRLDAPEAKWILYQVLQALVYLHEQLNVAHRDIKLENVILCDAGPFPRVQLADFGQASIANRDFQSLKGTLSYMAPEQLTEWTRKAGYDGKAADVWST
ncbi:hypothetical protein JCM11491_000531, partial [Sporobolomyces phaffii]